jgi:hypothetical protein
MAVLVGTLASGPTSKAEPQQVPAERGPREGATPRVKTAF